MYDHGERLAAVEVKVEHIDRTLDERQMIISAHSRRLATIEHHLLDVRRDGASMGARVTKLEDSDEITREERNRKRHQRALIQYGISIATGLAVIAGMMSARDYGIITKLLGGSP